MPTCPGPAEPREGQLADVLLLIRAEIVMAIKASPLSRYQIAGSISELLRREVSKDMLDKYCAESAEAYRVPADVLTALCVVLKTCAPFRPAVDPLCCVLAGPLLTMPPAPRDFRDSALAMVKEMGEYVAAVQEVLEDDCFNPGDGPRCDRELLDVIELAATVHEQWRRHRA